MSRCSKQQLRDSAWVPRLIALTTTLIGVANLASADPRITRLAQRAWHGRLMIKLVGPQVVWVSFALAFAAGAVLLVIAPYLLKRRRRALNAAIALMLLLGVVSLFKGLDLEGMTLHLAAAALFYTGRRRFNVVGDPISLRSAIWRVPLITAFGLSLVVAADWMSMGHPGLLFLLKESGALLRFRSGGQRFEVHTAALFGHPVSFEWIPLAVHLIEAGGLLLVAYVIFKPLAAPKALPTAEARRDAVQVVERHGSDTLSFFKLRRDKLYHFNDDRTAFVGYRVEAGVMLLSGDPVGPREAFPDLLLSVRDFARSRGLRLAALGASQALVPVYDGLGLHCLYLGDEAVIELSRFSLEGRPIRKVRQSVTRLRKAGYSCELRRVDEISEQETPALERVMRIGRIGKSERGFSMGMDSIHGEKEQDTLLAITRDRDGEIRGMLHLVPCYGRKAVSLSMMRRDAATPNGLMEFQVVSAVEMLRERGMEELSLNFATLTRYMRSPQNVVESALGHTAKLLNPYLQMESLYRFNVKFSPRWDPRFLVYEGVCGIPRAALAAIWAEGLVPKPRLSRPCFGRLSANANASLRPADSVRS